VLSGRVPDKCEAAIFPSSERINTMNASTRIALSTLLFALTLSASPPRAQPTATIDQLAFMTGHWTRTTDGMHVEQVFLPPAAGTMVGMQRRTRDDATLVSYFFIIQQTDDGIICRFKHFENDYATYEDRNNSGPRTFTMIENSPSSATFEERTPEGSLYLRYRINEAGQLAIAVASLEELESNSAAESLHDRIP
jgi:hypothetical protein